MIQKTLWALLCLIPLGLFSQTPQQMSYQFVLRNESGLLITSEDIGVRISILQGSETGEPIYIETHQIETNLNGAGSLKIGLGNVELGGFAHINWSEGPFFVQTETDPNGGSDYSIFGVSQIMSVPYALYAENGYFYKIGALVQGGIIFSLWKDDQGQEHGLVASVDDLSEFEDWGTMFQEEGDFDAANGALNSSMGPSAALCENYSYVDPNTQMFYDDYYLPAVWELNALARNAYIINAVLDSDGNGDTNGFPGDLNSSYWSSTEVADSFAWFVQFASGISNSNFKDTGYRVRAVRRF